MSRLLEDRIAQLTQQNEQLKAQHEENRANFEKMKAFFDQLPGTTLATVEAMQNECDRAHQILMGHRQNVLTLMQQLNGEAVGEKAA